MKLIANPSRLVLTLLCLGSAGCATEKVVAPLSNGYEEVSHPSRGSNDDTDLTRVSFEYKGSDGKTILIWPSLYGVKEVIKGNLAIFVGDMSYMEGGDKGTSPRLFAVRSPALPLDITDQLLGCWAKSAGKDLTQTLNKFILVTPMDKNGRLDLQLEFMKGDNEWPDQGILQLDWSQVSDIMREVKANGVELKELRWHTPYIGKKF